MTHAIVLDLTLPLDRFNVSVRWETFEGSLGIFGPSGAGKTTILEAVAGLRKGTRGFIRVNGRIWLDTSRNVCLPPERRGVGYVPQDALLFPHRNVMQNLMSGRRRAERTDRERVTPHRVLEVLELTDLAGRDVVSLSGGERQRVALGRALCSGPDLLLLDEPLANLDLPLRRRILPYLFRVREEFSIPTLFVSHDATEIKTLSKEVMVLASGKAIAHGRPDEVFTDPAVLPMTRTEGFENVLRGTVTDTSDSTATVAVEPGLRIAIAARDLVVGREVVLAVRAEDLILATQPPSGISAQNTLAGEIREIRATNPEEETGGQVLVAVTLGRLRTSLFATITTQACHRLALRPGTPVFLVGKANSFRVLATR
ncbi:MAG TPA: molybdenum ABC transporter ATP-binding protein [Candidatus Polarisedimenticolia bacterium]|nr:molybdenum ABC transporter ATP-binding protein [Candidatus Polarisedimenticolia bacterium]